jgi:hypothetical protein
MHNIGSDRIFAMDLVCYKYSHSTCYGYSTAVAVSYENKTFGVTVAHMNCSGMTPRNLIHCTGLDISIINECPPKANSFDANSFT